MGVALSNPQSFIPVAEPLLGDGKWSRGAELCRRGLLGGLPYTKNAVEAGGHHLVPDPLTPDLDNFPGEGALVYQLVRSSAADSEGAASCLDTGGRSGSLSRSPTLRSGSSLVRDRG